MFDVLTRGPFPTGAASDDGVEQHLRACHECRQLAEALRPAVALMHEAVTADQALDLPGYQGSLPLCEPRAARAPARVRRARTSRRTSARRWPTFEQWINGTRVLAASILVASIGLLLYSLSMAPGSSGSLAKIRGGFNSAPAVAAIQRASQPDEKGLLSLASLHLPVSCLPITHRPPSPQQAALMAAAIADGSLDALRCCTECHHKDKGRDRQPTARLVAVAQVNCNACHPQAAG